MHMELVGFSTSNKASTGVAEWGQDTGVPSCVETHLIWKNVFLKNNSNFSYCFQNLVVLLGRKFKVP